MSREFSRVGRSQQATFALMDTFAKTVLTCVPEPPPDAKPQAVARARDRYEQLIRNAGRSMSSDARTTMRELEDHGAPHPHLRLDPLLFFLFRFLSLLLFLLSALSFFIPRPYPLYCIFNFLNAWFECRVKIVVITEIIPKCLEI